MKRDIHIVTLLRKMKQKRLLRRVIAFLSVIVLLVTVNTLKFEADTLEHVATCGFEEHSHEEACFDENGALSCALTEHAHTDACFQNRPVKAGETDIEQPVEEMQTFELDDDADDELNASAFSAEAVMLDDGIEASADELDTFELSESEAIAPDFAAKRQGYTVGSQYPFLLSDVIAEQGLNISIDDVTRIEQLFENDEPALFRYELMDGDIALYPTADFELARLLIYTDNDVELVELLFGIAPTAEPVPDDEIEQAIYVEIEEKAEPIEPDEESETLEESETVEKTETIEETETVKEIEEEAEEITEEETETEEVTETVEETDAEQPGENDGEAMDEIQPEEIAADVAPAMRQAEATVSHYVATIDLSSVDTFPVALDALMAQAERVMIAEAAQSVDATIEPVDVNMESIGEAIEPAVDEIEASIEETTVTLEDVVETQNGGEVSETLEPLESEAIEPMLGEITIELGSDEAPGIPSDNAATTDDWALDYDAALLSIERTDEGYMLSVTSSFEQTVVTVNNGELYVLTLLNGAVRSEYPAATFSAATEHVVVNVEAPEGAFPAGTTMVVTDVEDEDTISSIAGKVEEGFVRVERVHAVDITFLNADGAEIEPLIPISVTMSVREIEAEKETVVVHVDHDGEAQIVAETTQVVSEAIGEELTAEADTALAFVADAFSVYAVVVGEKLETMAIAADGNTYRIEVTFAENASLPAGAALAVSEVTDDNYLAQVQQSMAGEKRVTMARFFDIKIMNGDEEIQPDAPVMVKVALDSDAEKEADAVPCAVHFTGDEISIVKATEADEAVSFRAESFSVWGVVYTVDFHWQINGKTYEYSIPGGGYLSFAKLMEILGVAEDGIPDVSEDGALEMPVEQVTAAPALEDVQVSEATKEFVADVEHVSFSNPDYIWVGKIDADNTVGALKEANGLACEYSAELTEAQIAQINAQPVEAGDWALISVQPFRSEEWLTVTMKEGEQFTIRVTDAQIKRTVISARGDTYEVTVTYFEDALLPDGVDLKVREILPEDEDYAALQRKIGGGLDGLEDTIPSHPALFDIGIYDGETEIEPAEGSSVQVEIRLVKSGMNGIYTEASSPVLINELPVRPDEQEVSQTLRIVHDVADGSLEVVDVEEAEADDEIIGQFETDSFSNWLLFLDEDIETLNVYQGDSITLRPYGKWYWKKNDPGNVYSNDKWVFPSEEYDIENGSTEVKTDYNYNGNTKILYGIVSAQPKGKSYGFKGEGKYDRQLLEEYWYYNMTVPSDATPGQTFQLHTAQGKTINVIVNQGTNPQDIPPEITNVANIPVNFFDYDLGGVLDLGKWNGTINRNLSGDPGYTFTDTINNNSYGIFKFFSSGTGGTHGNYVNHYTQDIPHQGIVNDTLGADHFPTIKSEYDYGRTWSLDYLFDKNQTSWRNGKDMIAYPNVVGLFQQDSDGYYYYNSNSNYYYYDTETRTSHLYTRTYSQDTEGTGGHNAKPMGFFPFHPYNSTDKDHLYVNQNTGLNHHFGMSMEVTFALPANKKLENGHDIIYDFSGDDDLWVFIDDDLALDIGGLHQPVRGYINFTTGKVYVYGVNGNQEKEIDFIKNLKTGREYTLRMFYLERGGCDSNLSVKFNIPVTIGRTDVYAVKAKEKDDPNEATVKLPGATFGLWENETCSGLPVRTQTSDANGDVDFDDVPIKEENQVYYMKEIKAPSGYYLNETIYKVTASHKDGAQPWEYECVVTVNGDPDSVAEHKPIISDKPTTPIALTVQKEWLGGIPENASASFEVKRYKSYDGLIYNNAQPCTLNVYRYKNNNDPVLLFTKSYNVGTNVVVSWNYSGGYYGYNGSGNLPDVYGQYNFDRSQNWSKSNNNTVTITMSQAGENRNLYLRDENIGTNYISGVADDASASPDSNYSNTLSVQRVTVINGEDTGYQGPTITLKSSPWTYTFPEQDAYHVRSDGITEYYTYYIVETSSEPEGYLAAYDSMTGDKITGSSESETRVITNYRDEVYVEKRWYGMDGELLDLQPTSPVDATLLEWQEPQSGAGSEAAATPADNGAILEEEKTKPVVAGTSSVWKVINDASKRYTAVEDPVPEGFEVNYTFKDVSEQTERTTGGVHRGGTVYINNRQSAVPVIIKKVKKGSNQILTGAAFTLTRVEDDSRIVITEEGKAYTSGSQTVDEETGKIDFGWIKPGHYKLEEDTVPHGFIKTEGPYYFKIDAVGAITLDEEYQMISIDEEGDITFIIENEPGAKLPATGGPGTAIFTATGLAMIALAAFLLLRRKAEY